MPRFKGQIATVVLSSEELNRLLTLPAQEIDEWSPVKVEMLEDKNALYDKFARSIADTIKKNHQEGKTTAIVVPVGPCPQYRILAAICNRERISWKKVWTFNMDEYLDWEGRPVGIDHPMSFRRFMNAELFQLLDEELRIPAAQSWFPDPFNPDAIDGKIAELGGIDVAYGGIGYHGHIAFNEPVPTYFTRLTPEEFKNSKTRVVPLREDTFVINSLCGLGGNCYSLPPMAVTLGMKSILEARRIELYCDGWILEKQQTTFRLACMHPPTLDRPVTFVQEHPDPKNTVLICADRETAAPVNLELQ